MRLDKYLAYAGFGTRKEVKRLIRKKHVVVNDVLCDKDDYKIDEKTDVIRVDDVEIVFQMQVYLMLNKPAGVISATQDAVHETVFDLITEPLPPDCFPVGRLDIDTEGLLLITNDGKLAHDVLSPKKHVDKTYYVELQAPLTMKDIRKLEAGITIDKGEVCLPAVVEKLDETRLYLTIQEGKYHQIKRMMNALDNHVVYLKRVRMGPLHLDEHLSKGAYRPLREEEIKQLKKGIK